MKYLKRFGLYSVNESRNLRSGFLTYASEKSSSTNIYPSYRNIVDKSLEKFSCQVGPFIISFDDTTKREYKSKQVATSTLKVWCQDSLTKEQVLDPENSGVQPDDIFELMPGYIQTEEDKRKDAAAMEIAKDKAKKEIDAAGGYEEPGVTKTAYHFYKPSGNLNEYRWVGISSTGDFIDCYKESLYISDLIFKIKKELKVVS